MIGVCAGAKVVAEAGLLDGKRATTHWYYVHEMIKKHAKIRYVADRRFVVDEGVATTTGITASMPMMLTLIEAIAGRARAESVALELGSAVWDSRHVSSAFKLTRPFVLTVMSNAFTFWQREIRTIELSSGIDEVSLAVVADAWSRTYRSRAVTIAPTASAFRSRNGARIIPDRVASNSRSGRDIELIPDRPFVSVLHDSLTEIERRYGMRTAEVVRMQLEYPGQSPLE